MRSTTRVAFVATTIAAALTLAACSGDGGGSGDGDGTASGGGDGAGYYEGEGELFQINSTPREDLVEGGTLTLDAGEALPAQWNPLHVNGNQGSYSEIRALITAGGLVFNGEGVPEVNEDYLLSMDDEVVDGQQVVTLTINPEAKWNNGDPIDWEDYAATLTVCNGENADISCVTTDGYDQIESVEMGEDEFQVVITFKSTYPDWTSMAGGPLPAESIADTDTFENGWTDVTAINDWFTGPFKIDSVDTAQQIITMVPNENWWGNPPLLDEVVWRVVSAEAAPQAFQNGEIDAFDVGPDPNGYQIANSTAGTSVRTTNGPDWRHITFNSTAGVLQDLEVRQAIVKGLDRQAIAASDLAGLPQEYVKQLGNHIFVNGQEGYVDNTGDFTFNQEAAAAQLDAAGWVLNEATGIREKDGEPLSVQFSVLTGVPVSENEGQLVQQQLAQIGVDVTLYQQDTATWGEALADGDFEMIAFSWLGTPYPMGGIGQIYGDPETNSSNYARLNNDEINDLVDQVNVETDPQTRIDLANQIDVLIWEEVHTLPLYQRPQIVATVENLANYGAEGFSSYSSAHPEDWGFTE
jgi:peptide/nickel transport system substrate-binding protein